MCEMENPLKCCWFFAAAHHNHRQTTTATAAAATTNTSTTTTATGTDRAQTRAFESDPGTALFLNFKTPTTPHYSHQHPANHHPHSS